MVAVALVSKFVSFFSCSVQALNKRVGYQGWSSAKLGQWKKSFGKLKLLTKGSFSVRLYSPSWIKRK